MYYNRAGTGVCAGATGKATTIVFAKQDTQAKTVRKVSMRRTEPDPATASWISHVRLPLFPDLLPPSGLHVVRVEENEVELRWDQPEPAHSLVSGFVVTYGPLGRSSRKSDLLDRHRSTHVMRGLAPGVLYNISTFSTKRSTNNNDISQPATALIRTSERARSYCRERVSL